MIYLYDVICYAHPRTSVPTNNARLHTHTRTHTARLTPRRFHLTPWHKHAHARTYTNMYVLISYLSSLSCSLFLTISIVRVIYVSRVHRRVHAYVCTCTYSEYLTVVFFFLFFLRRLQLCNCFRLEEKATRGRAGQVLIITVSTSSWSSPSSLYLFPRYTNKTYFNVVFAIQNIKKRCICYTKYQETNASTTRVWSISIFSLDTQRLNERKHQRRACDPYQFFH